MPKSLERKGLIATVIGTAISAIALIWSIWTYFYSSENAASQPVINNPGAAIIIQGNDNKVVALQNQEAPVRPEAARYIDISISEQTLDLSGKKNHEVHYPRLSGKLGSDALARSNHFLKRMALTAYERYADWDEVSISYTVGFQEFNLLGINYEIFISNEGAAHPLTTMKAVALDLETGSAFELKDLFKPEYLNHLNSLVSADLISRELYFPCEAEKNLDMEMKKARDMVQGVLKDILGHESKACFNSVSDNNHYYLTDTSLVLVFSKYSIAPGMAGDIKVGISYEDLLKFLNQDGPLKRFL